MKYTMTTPCTECPYLIGSGFTYRSLMEHASGEFGCHKACELSKEGIYEPSRDTPHCAGALIFLEKQDKPHQMMRICERLGLYDRTKLNMDANVGSKTSDYRRWMTMTKKKYFVAMDDNYTPHGTGKSKSAAIKDATIDGEFKKSDLTVYECSEELFNKLLIPGWSDIGYWTITRDGFMDIDPEGEHHGKEEK